MPSGGSRVGAGRKRVPSNVRDMRGDKKVASYNSKEPKPSTGLPPIPRGLTPPQKKAYRKFGRQILSLGIMAEVDGAALATLAIQWARWEELNKELNEAGSLTYEKIGAKGQKTLMKHPAVAMSNEAMKHVITLLSQFGLTPASRGKVKVIDQSKPTVGNPEGKDSEQGKWADL